MESVLRKAIGSGINLNDFDNNIAAEYNECVADIIELPEVLLLDNYSQHLNTSRYQHSLNVSYYSFLMAKSMHCDARSAARGGLLHDLFFYDWKNTTLSCSKHAFWHPHIALENAGKLVELNDIEQDIIVKHMWPLTIALPKYKESFLVSFADKYCATYEVAGNITNKLYIRNHA